MPKVSSAQKDETRRRLIDAAHRCLAANGFADVTTRVILTEAELSPGTLYNYFDSKADLYAQVAQELLERDLLALHGATEPDADAAAALRRFLEDQLLELRPSAVALAGFRSTMNDPDGVGAVASLNRWVVEQFAPIVEDARRRGALDADLDVEAFVELLDLLWDGLGRRTGQDSFATSADRVGAVVLALFDRVGVTAAPTA